MRIPFISLIAGSALALGGCAYGDLGMGLGYGGSYGPYGSYGSPYYGASYGYGSSYYGGYGYGSPYYGGYGGYGGYGSPYYGWSGDYYYPGSGYYVYDSFRRPHVMSTTQRQYWSSRSPALRTTSTRTVVKPNWSAFNQRTTARAERQAARTERQTAREERRAKRRTDD
jgi:hypothetical protein